MAMMRSATLIYVLIMVFDAVFLLPASFLVEAGLDKTGLGVWIVHSALKIAYIFVVNASLQPSYDTLRPVLEAWQKRFQLIVLITLGEIVVFAASGRGGGDIV